MATFKAIAGTIKNDKTFPVSIQVYHKGQKKYVPTSHFVVKSQLTGKGAIKDKDVTDMLDTIIKGYRKKLLDLHNISQLTAQQIKDFLLKNDATEEIDYIKFGEALIKTQTKSTGSNTRAALSSLTDFLGRDNLPILDMNLHLLNAWVKYLRTPRTAKRDNGHGGVATKKLKPLSDTGVKDYIGKMRQIFKAAQDEFNDDNNKIRVPHYPFKKLKIPRIVKAEKRNLEPAEIALIRDAPNLGIRANLGRDVFMLSFYLVGMNLADLFLAEDYKDGRISYHRAKTFSRKGQDAFISIKVEPEAVPLIEKYRDPKGKRLFKFYLNYATGNDFLAAANKGLKIVCEHLNKDGALIEPEVSTYYARGSWSTIARNDCKVPKEDIHFALNHSDPRMKITDLYIEEDFEIVDKANRAVIDLVNG